MSCLYLSLCLLVKFSLKYKTIKGELVSKGLQPTYVSLLTKVDRSSPGNTRVSTNFFSCRIKKTGAWIKGWMLKELFGPTIEVARLNANALPQMFQVPAQNSCGGSHTARWKCCPVCNILY